MVIKNSNRDRGGDYRTNHTIGPFGLRSCVNHLKWEDQFGLVYSPQCKKEYKT